MKNNYPEKEKPEVAPLPLTPTINPKSPPEIIPQPEKNTPEKSPPEFIPSTHPEIIPLKETE